MTISALSPAVIGAASGSALSATPVLFWVHRRLQDRVEWPVILDRIGSKVLSDLAENRQISHHYLSH